MDPHAPPTNKEIENLWKIYETINEWIRFSDTKATAILAINGVITGFYFSNIAELRSIIAQQLIAFIALDLVVSTIVISTLCSTFCIVPRLKIGKKSSLIFFFDIAKNFSTVGDYAEAVNQTLKNDTEIKTQIVNQIWANSKVAFEKYGWVKRSAYFFVGTVFANIAFVISALM